MPSVVLGFSVKDATLYVRFACDGAMAFFCFLVIFAAASFAPVLRFEGLQYLGS